MRRHPTEREHQVLTFCRERTANCLRFPTMREIQLECRISSTSVVQYTIEALVRQGRIVRTTCGNTTVYSFPDMRGSLIDLVKTAEQFVQDVEHHGFPGEERQPMGYDPNENLFEQLRRSVSDAKFVWQIT